MVGQTWKVGHFDVRRLRASPTAIGRWPLLFFGQARSVVLMHLRTVDSEMVAEGGGGSGGVDAGGPWESLDSISLRIVSDGLARPVEVRAWID